MTTHHRHDADIFSFAPEPVKPGRAASPAGRRFNYDVIASDGDDEVAEPSALETPVVFETEDPAEPASGGRHFQPRPTPSDPSYRPRHGSSDQEVADSDQEVADSHHEVMHLDHKAVDLTKQPAAPPKSVRPASPVGRHLRLAPAVPVIEVPALLQKAVIPRHASWVVLVPDGTARPTLSSRRAVPKALPLRSFLPALPALPPLPALWKPRQDETFGPDELTGVDTTDATPGAEELDRHPLLTRVVPLFSHPRAWHLPPRILAAATVAAIIGVAVTQLVPSAPSSSPSNELAAATAGTVIPDRSDTSALQAASRSFVRESVATPSAAAPTTTEAPTTTMPPTTLPPPTTTAAPKPAVVPNNYAGCSASKQAAKDCWWGLISQYNWNDDYAFNVMWCESHGNPYAKNPRSTATGLFQILGGPTDPVANVRQAAGMWANRGWQPWVCKG